MAYTWEPKWEPFEINVDGIVVKTCRDRYTGLIACPICIHAVSSCLGGKPPENYQFENSYFFTVDDLISHLKTYHVRGWHRRIESVVSKSSEEED
ncbi:hypothetical protein DKAM_0155 [Desulfurococcus amylolyticus 1221n]|uniref:Uncharacterized protein n=1 Tax=Desulfurococcus amylolyticus (strain DSM 18924 / JCM 16383 / VKM B-2413 / 1221n) TaxID=490899 RepID=B8D2T7_DESA1|nr:hypothetical protein [Desulfurococcus amylolyticus]ACL10484.1 hypothetical protein DKAM_0155 [Desulfurococcus amylolyticus 1221n]